MPQAPRPRPHALVNLLRGAGSLDLDPAALLAKLLDKADANRDGRITAGDLRARGPVEIDLPIAPGLELRVRGSERLAQLAALLSDVVAAGRPGRARVEIEDLLRGRVAEALALVTSAWDGLTRRADHAHSLIPAARGGDCRPADGVATLYVPASDPPAVRRLRREVGADRGARVVVFPDRLSRETLASLARRPGIAYLPHPYLVPGGRFEEMYGWDSYFMALGALATGRPDLALAVAENQIYEALHYGKIPNSNRSWHLSRSQPPMLGRLVLRLHDWLDPLGDPRALPFLRRGAHAVERELERVWLRPPRITPTGLSRYHDEAGGPVAEIPPGAHPDRPRTAEGWRHDRALRESGWDLTHRFGRRAHRHLPVCLNALLYQQEASLAEMWRRIEGERSTRAARWTAASEARRRRMDALLWDARRGLYLDFDLDAERRGRYETLATFYPLWVGAASEEQAARVAESAELFLERGGLATSSRRSRERAGRAPFQWDWPLGWAPLQIIAVEGLRRYGFLALADEVAYRWLWMVLRIAGNDNGLLVEKYDVVRRSAQVEAEYENQGADRGAYLDRQTRRPLGFGWTNAAIPLLLAALPRRLRRALDQGQPPRQVVFSTAARPA